MLTGIGLRNFKAFGDEMQEAPLSKITLIYGPNSGGKSSIIQALLLLKQSLKPSYGRFRRLEPKGEYVDLGSPQAILHKHDTERDIGLEIKYKDNQPNTDVDVSETTIGLTCSSNGELSQVSHRIVTSEDKEALIDAVIRVPDGMKFVWERDSNEVDIKVLGIPANNNFAHSHHGASSFLPIWFLMDEDQLIDEAVPLAEALTEYVDEFVMDGASSLVGAAELARTLEGTRKWAGRTWLGAGARTLTRARTSVLGTAQVRAEDIETELASELELERALKRALGIEKFNLSDHQLEELFRENYPIDYEHYLRAINYLAPLRSAPQRLYRHSDKSDASTGITGIQGEFSASVLHHSEEVRDAVNLWFEQFDVPYELDVIKLGEDALSGEYITIALTDKRTGTQVTLADVGYGINQILPVIIEGIASQEGAILCVEQPEIHLHPRLQANIADLMIDTIADEPGKRKQWIVETHSELLIRRIRTRIAQGDISPSDVSVLYVDPDDEDCEGSSIKQLRLDENGYWLDEWPHGFFDDGYKQTRLARRARLAKDNEHADKVRS